MLIGGILLIVVAIAVIGIVLAVVQPRKTYRNSFQEAGPLITDNLFETELPLLSANSNT